MSAIAQTMGVARSTLTAHKTNLACLAKPKGRPPQPEAVLVAEIEAIIATAVLAVGLVAITDVLESQAAFDNTRVRRIQAQGDLAIFFENLRGLTGAAGDGVR